jgi:hypothetical protein
MKKLRLIVTLLLLTTAGFAGHIRFIPSPGVKDIDFNYFEASSPVPNSYCVQGSFNYWFDHQHVNDPTYACDTSTDSEPAAPIARVNSDMSNYNILVFTRYSVTKINGKPAPSNCLNLARTYNFKSNDDQVFALSPQNGCVHQS